MANKEMPYYLGPKNYTDEWHKWRLLNESNNPEFVCGASEAGVICGTSKYKTTLELYMEKRGLKEAKSSTENMRWGNILEPAIMNEYKERMGESIKSMWIPNRLLISSGTPFIGASPDGIVENEDGGWCVDAKITTSRMFDKDNAKERDCFGEGEDEVPSDYIMQAHQQMFVTNLQRCDFPVLFDGNKLRIYTVQRNEEVVKMLVRKIEKFFQMVVDGVPPEPDWDHGNTVNLMKGAYGISDGVSVELGGDATGYLQEYLKCKEQIGIMTKAKEAMLSRLLYMMGDASSASVPGVDRMLYRTEIKPTLWLETDVDAAIKKIGQVKRKGYVRITDRKVK